LKKVGNSTFFAHYLQSQAHPPIGRRIEFGREARIPPPPSHLYLDGEEKVVPKSPKSEKWKTGNTDMRGPGMGQS
jgi:hypothetical protein